MLSFILASMLCIEAGAAAREAGKCCCNEAVVTSYTATVIGPSDGWGGSMPNVRFVPNRIEFKRCDYAAKVAHRKHRRHR